MSLNFQEEHALSEEAQELGNAAGNEETGRTDDTLDERTYSQAEVEEIIQGHLRRFQSMPVSVDQQAADLAEREMKLEKKAYLTQKIQSFAPYFPKIKGPGSSSEFFCKQADGLFGFLEPTQIDSFKKAVDTMIRLFEDIKMLSFDHGKDACRDEYRSQTQKEERKQDEDRDIWQEIFEKGGRF